MAKIGSYIFGAVVLGLTGAAIYAGLKSGAAADKLQTAYLGLRPRDRFVGMLYLTAEQDGQAVPAEDISRLSSKNDPAALLAMELFSATSPADRRLFVDVVFSSYNPLEKAFSFEEVRAIRGILDARKVPYSSTDAERIVLATLPALAARLQITA